MKDDIFDEIAKYVPEAHRPAYWRMVAHFRQLKPDDEIVNIIFAMGILTFILRELPSGIVEERKALQKLFNSFREEANTIREGSNRHMITVANHVEAVSKALEQSGAQFMERTARIEMASQRAVDRIDVDDMAQRLTARVEERVLIPFKALIATMEKNLQLLEKIGEQILRLIAHLREIHMGRMIAATSAVIFALCGGVFFAAYWHLQDADQTALNDQLSRIGRIASANQDAFALLAANNITVEVAGVVDNGVTQIGQKALRLTPASDVRMETPDGRPKSGIIYFQVIPTFQDQMEHSEQEIQRILRQYPASK